MTLPRPTVAFALALLVCPGARCAGITAFAAASLSDALPEAAPLFTAATGHTVRFSFGASGTLARQVAEGAPADVIISADEARLDDLDRGGLLLAGTRRAVLSNQLVLVVAEDSAALATALGDLAGPDVRRIAIGDPALVPAGTYARRHLQETGLWEALRAKLVPLDNVRAVLAAVDAGNVDAGFVFRTDALVATRLRIALAIDPSEGLRISYPAAVVRATRHPEAARAFVEWLAGGEAQSLFAKHGFLPPR